MDPRILEIPEFWAERLTADVIAATTSIKITALSMQPPRTKQAGPWPTLWDALCRAAARQVRVEISIAAAAKAHPATSSNTGSARYAHQQGMIVHLIPGPKLLHAKQVVIDHAVLWIGSGNFTAAACAHNHETWCRIDSATLAARVEQRIHAYRETPVNGKAKGVFSHVALP